MDDDSRRKFEAKLAELSTLDPSNWANVAIWTSAMRPLVVHFFERHVDQFDNLSASPKSLYLGSSSRSVSTAVREANRRRAAEGRQALHSFVESILNLPARPQVEPAYRQEGFHVGDKYDVRITNSTLGAAAVGAGATATGSVSAGLTQEQHRSTMSAAQGALVSDQDALDGIEKHLYDVLHQFLRIARETQVEQKNLAEVQLQMKSTLDDVWAERAAEGLRPKLPEALEVVKALAASPAMAVVVKSLLVGA